MRVTQNAFLRVTVGALLLAESTNAFLPNTRRVTRSTTSVAAASSWKDLPLPELPSQTVNGIQFTAPTIAIPDFLTDLLTSLEKLLSSSPESLQMEVQKLVSSLESFQMDQINVESLSNILTTFLSTQWQIEAIAIFTVGNILYQWLNSPLDFSQAPFEPGTDTYSPTKSDEFYSQRPFMVLKRILQLGYLSGSFTTGLLFDWLVLGKLFKDEEYTALKKAEPKRAKESLRLCEQLGPTFIKLVSETIVCTPCS